MLVAGQMFYNKFIAKRMFSHIWKASEHGYSSGQSELLAINIKNPATVLSAGILATWNKNPTIVNRNFSYFAF